MRELVRAGSNMPLNQTKKLLEERDLCVTYYIYVTIVTLINGSYKY